MLFFLCSRYVLTAHSVVYIQRVIELNSAQTKMIPDTFRADQISFINSVPVTLRHKRHDVLDPLGEL